MSFLAPYTNAMRIGQGFNSYTQEICIENAVLIEPVRKARPIRSRRPNSFAGVSSLRPLSASTAVSAGCAAMERKTSNESLQSDATASEAGGPLEPRRPSSAQSAKSMPNITVGSQHLDPDADAVQPAEAPPRSKEVVQIVTYSSRMVDNVSDIVEALNISSSASIKYGTIKGAGSTSIVNENKVNQSDLNYIVTVKVTNETSPLADKMTFNPIPELDNRRFTEVFGDCFISGFTEGGEFSAIVSIKVNDKAKVTAVKAAAEAEMAVAAAPGLSVGAKQSVDKHKSDVWDDTEMTISVNWAGGGNIKPPDDKWDLKTVVDVATRFPHLVQTCAQRTSAILTRYTSLRSFNEANARNPADDKFRILDYDLCSLYTQDLFDAFLAYKNIWSELADILKYTEQYREREPGPDVPNPIQLTPKGLNEARLLARKGMTQISDITKSLQTTPSLADFDENGKQKAQPYMWPSELRKRMPVRHHGLTIREQADLVRRDTNFGLLTSEEVGKIGHWARDSDLEFTPLVGDHIQPRHSWSGKEKDTLFCTLDSAADSTHLDNLTKLRIHGYEDKSINWLGMFGRKTRSRRCHGHVSAIGFSTAHDTSSPSRQDGVHRAVGKSIENNAYWSQPLADFRYAKVSKVRIEYVPGSGRLAALIVLDSTGQELTSWKQYGQAKVSPPAGLKIVEQEPPDERSGWVLAGFWGHNDSMVINSIGAIWRK
ncbi:hypothetical protein ACLMJK_005672 [Lecanora helva]